MYVQQVEHVIRNIINSRSSFGDPFTAPKVEVLEPPCEFGLKDGQSDGCMAELHGIAPRNEMRLMLRAQTYEAF